MGGFATLNPKSFQWISGDNTSGYIAQLFFLSDKWRFPLGSNPNFGLDLSTSLVYTGPPLPIMLIQKALRLDPSLQFIGFWLLFVIIFQVFFGISLGASLGMSPAQSRIFGLLLVTPFFLYRFQFHFWLTSHFLLIWAFWIVVRSAKFNRLLTFEVAVLIFFGYLINTYLLIMSLIIISYPIVQEIYKLKSLSRQVKRHTGAATLILIFSFLVVDFKAQTATFVESLRMNFTGEYTYYSSNLLALLNPEVGYSRNCRAGHCIFGNASPPSYVINNFSITNIDMGGVQGNYEGFLYLGLGLILLVLFVLILESRNRSWKQLKSLISRNLVLVIYVIFVTLYAITYKISFGNFQLDLGDPKLIRWALSSFRASGRFMWIVAYLVIVLAILVLLKRLSPTVVSWTLSLVLLLQVIDLGPSIYERYNQLRIVDQISIQRDKSFENYFANAVKGKSAMIMYPSGTQKGWPELAYLAWNNELRSGMVQSSRVNNGQKKRADAKIKELICKGKIQDKDIVLIPIEESEIIRQCKSSAISYEFFGSFIFLQSGKGSN
jgi:hypothetical protein